jgi:hypothetical protein
MTLSVDVTVIEDGTAIYVACENVMLQTHHESRLIKPVSYLNI